MTIRIHFLGNRLLIAGLGSVLLLFALLVLLHRADFPGPEQAREDVRHFLRSEISQGYLEELKATGREVPDHATALCWQAELQQIDRLEIVSVKIARPLPAYLHGWRSYVVKAVIRGPRGETETRHVYFGPAEITERSKMLWWISF